MSKNKENSFRKSSSKHQKGFTPPPLRNEVKKGMTPPPPLKNEEKGLTPPPPIKPKK